MDHLVDFSTGDIIKVHSGDIAKFEKIAMGNTEKKRYRMCEHDSPENELQDMFICMTKGEYARPHKRIENPETHMVVGGKLMVFFSDDGEIIDAFVMDNKDGYLYYRINANVYHMEIILTDVVVGYEARLGPFVRETSNIFPDWAPDGSSKAETDAFIEDVKTLAMKFIENKQAGATL